jgi:hypothetical protein
LFSGFRAFVNADAKHEEGIKIRGLQQNRSRRKETFTAILKRHLLKTSPFAAFVLLTGYN